MAVKTSYQTGVAQAPETSLWDFYFPDTIQDAVDGWTLERCLAFLEDPKTKGLAVMEPIGNEHVDLKLAGECSGYLHGESPCKYPAEVYFRIWRGELSAEQKRAVMAAVKRAYPGSHGEMWQVRRKTAAALNTPV